MKFRSCSFWFVCLFCGHLNFNCLKLKYEVLKFGVWLSDPYLYYNSFKDTPVCGQLDFNCLKLKYKVNHDILLFILAPGYTVSTWGRCGSRGGDRGSGPPLENHKVYGFLLGISSWTPPPWKMLDPLWNLEK